MKMFLSIATHDLRNPVASSSLGVQMVARRFEELIDRLPRQVEQDTELAGQLVASHALLARARDSLERLNRMVIDLLDFSRVQAGQLAVQQKPADLGAIVRAAVHEQRQLAPTRHIRLCLREAPSALVWADADRIRHVVTNYLTNALKYAPAEQPIDVQIQVDRSADSGWAHISVCDRGPGLPDDEQARIWEPFHRAEGIEAIATSPYVVAQSLGLGLYISKLIIEQHKGYVGVSSAAGQGATFWFTLPLDQSACDVQCARSA